MCIAIVKPHGYKVPDKNALQICWNNNPDGAGFCYNDGTAVVIHKGYMDFKSFYKALKTCNKKNNLTDKDVAIHFRISTGGGVKPENTHPFCVSHKIEDLQKTYSKCKDAFVHNGIIYGYGTKDYSDTMDYVTRVISNIRDVDRSPELIDALATEKNSRFAIVNPKSFILGGHWIKDGGLFYSNSSYKAPVIKWNKASNTATQKSLWSINPAWSATRKCDFCQCTFLKKDLQSVYCKADNYTYHVCKDCADTFIL